MYYNNISCTFKIILEIFYTCFYMYYYYFFSFISENEEENDIIFFCGYGNIPGEKNKWNGNTPFMGGSENSLILLAESLVPYYNVKIYNNCQKNITIKGVKYINSKYFNYSNSYSNVVFWRFPLPLLLFSYNFKIKNKILWLHDGEPLCKFFELFRKGSYIENMIVNCYDRIDYIISPSKFLYTKIIRYDNQKLKKSFVIPNFVKRNSLNFKKSKDNKILWHINFNRGLKKILDNWNKIRELSKDFEIHIYGNKDELYLNSNLYDNINIENVYFHSKIEHSEIIKLIPEFKFFLYPAIIRESFSISTWECLINGCIPIVYDTGAIGEIINYDGIVVPPGNFEGILENIRLLLNEDNYSKQINKIESHDFSFVSENNIIKQWLFILKESDGIIHNHTDSSENITDDYKDIFEELKTTYTKYSLDKYKYKIP
jgi:glycosyltransferase involved in cell wall biosynthesis